MPELPEVEVLVRHLRPLLAGRRIERVSVRREKVVRPTRPRELARRLRGARFVDVSRRGKYLVFLLKPSGSGPVFTLLGHLGMTGRMWLAKPGQTLPKHTAVCLDLGSERLVFEDTRYFGRLTLELSPLRRLGPEPLGKEFTPGYLAQALGRSGQAVKVKLLDQALVAGVGNIYASEAVFRAGLSPFTPCDRLDPGQIARLRRAIRSVLREAVRFGSTVPLRFGGGKAGGLFYFGREPGAPDFYQERLRVYDRAGQPCGVCGTAVERAVQGARATYFCPRCQPGSRKIGRKQRGESV